MVYRGCLENKTTTYLQIKIGSETHEQQTEGEKDYSSNGSFWIAGTGTTNHLDNPENGFSSEVDGP